MTWGEFMLAGTLVIAVMVAAGVVIGKIIARCNPEDDDWWRRS